MNRSRRRRSLYGGWVIVLWSVVAFALSIPAGARAADCSLADTGYNGACGPQFELPAWGDGAGWTDPSKYTTIQLADLSGNGVDDLIARNDDGIEIWRFDATLGQWRPALDKYGLPEVLPDFRSPLVSEAGPNWNQPQYYATIQTADLDGPGHGADIVARFPSGIRVYTYSPKAGTKSIDGGSWSLVSQNGPFSDADGYTDPALYRSIHAVGAADGQPGELVAQSRSGLVVYDWTGSGWTKRSPSPYGQFSPDPSSYLGLQVASLTTKSGVARAVISRSAGVLAQYESGGKWLGLAAQPSPGPFADVTGSVDCPFEPGGSGCFGSSPSYYETLRFGDIIGDSFPYDREMLGRASDGLRVWELSADGTKWQRLATLTALKGASPPPGQWATIRLARILGTKSQQVLALDGTGLQAWSYDAQSNAWTKLTSGAPLNLGGKMWDDDPSYYSTIQAGDVLGNGREAVIARGPYGIRTWFYNLNGNSGWTSYRPQDTSSYPQFSGGQAAAFAALTSQARGHGAIPPGDGSVRDFWTGENAPSLSNLSGLQSAIVSFAGCSGSPGANPPFAVCTPPAGSAGFTAADWTEVVNEVLAEIGMTEKSVTFFAQLDTLRQKMFISQGADLDAIASTLGVQGAAGDETTVRPAEIAATVLKIVGAIATEIPVAGKFAGPALEAAGELEGLLASDSRTLTSSFSATYADLKDKFATMVAEIDKGLEVQSAEVRSNYNLLSLLAQLTTGGGPWSDPDTIGLESANDQGFALWVYKQLLPTMYARYMVSSCGLKCSFSGAGPETIGARPNFTTIGPAPTSDRPCVSPGFNYPTECQFTALPETIATRVWGSPSDTCNYRPGNAATKWTFGCNEGVNKASSVSLADGPANGWDFASYCYDGTSLYDHLHGCSAKGDSATVAANGGVTLTATVKLPKDFQVKSATIGRDDLLDEPAGPDGGASDLVSQKSGRALGVIRLAASRPGAKSFASTAPPIARLQLGEAARGQMTADLTVKGVSVAVPSACQALPASEALVTPPFELISTVRFSDGRRTLTMPLPALWRCVRSSTREISQLRPLPPPPLYRRSGLALRVAGPRAVTAGTIVTYRMRVRNVRHRSGSPLVSALWNLTVRGTVSAGRAAGDAGTSHDLSLVTRHIAELSAGRSTIVKIDVRAPHSSATRVCVRTEATANSARPAVASLCSLVAR